tara:strand:+ start:14689 stop:16143 length:1455 start_codon:yes stop_codon:yes gene_type:complete
MQISEVILGPPGCGKTTALIAKLTSLVEMGQDPARIGIASFTKTAAAEISNRAGASHTKIGTLHSMAYRLAEIDGDQVIDREWLIQFSGECGIKTQGVGKQEIEELNEGDAYLALNSYMGATRQTDPTAAFLDAPCEGTLEKWLYWYESYNAFKKAYGVIDFNDMLADAIGANPEIDVLILDESQDFSPLQWELIEGMLPYVQEVVIAGDDDQAIYKWSGADPHGMAKFIEKHKSTVTVLSQSYRVPRDVHELAEFLIGHIDERLEKKYEPRDADGQVSSVGTFSMLHLREDQDTMILVRNHSLRSDIEDTLMRKGIAYGAEGGYPAPLKNRYAQCINSWLQAKKSNEHMGHAALTQKQLRQLSGNARGLYKQRVMSDAEGLLEEGITWQRLLQIPSHFHHYYGRILNKHRTLNPETKIRICTMHASKGREADRVIVVNGMGARTAQAFENDRDSEYRTFYVAITRSRDILDIVQDANGLDMLT